MVLSSLQKLVPQDDRLRTSEAMNLRDPEGSPSPQGGTLQVSKAALSKFVYAMTFKSSSYVLVPSRKELFNIAVEELSKPTERCLSENKNQRTAVK